MLRVKSKQIDAFAHAAAVTFPERLLGFLQRELATTPSSTPDRAAGAPALTQAGVDDAIARAHGWGLRHERDVATFAVLVFTQGPSFDEQPWARELLVVPGVPASARIHQVYEAAIRRAVIEGTALARKEGP